MRQLTKAEQCRAMMYKRSAVARLNYSEICDSLYDMTSMCCDIKYAEQDDDTLINAFDGNEDEAHEFILQFSDLEYDIENLQNQFDEMFGYSDDPERDFNDVTVALIGKWFSLLGFDAYREDYFELSDDYFENLGTEECQKRVMRKTKKEMLESIGLTMAFLLKFSDVEYRYRTMETTLNIFRDENIRMLKTVKEIDEKYKDLFDEHGRFDKYRYQQIREFDKLVRELPEKYWVE